MKKKYSKDEGVKENTGVPSWPSTAQYGPYGRYGMLQIFNRKALAY
jgi:hypothetical protein